MGKVAFDFYGRLAEKIEDPHLASARALQARDRSRLIALDIIQKLDLRPWDTLLDIGCGVGQQAIPLSFFVKHVTAIDNQQCVDRLRRRAPLEDITLIAGDFLDLSFAGQFTKILAYSMVHYLSSLEHVVRLIDHAVELLAPNGLLLIGDIPNADLKNRYEATPEGQAYARWWNAGIIPARVPDEQLEIVRPLSEGMKDPDLPTFTDKVMSGLVEKLNVAGYEAYRLPQRRGDPPDWREGLPYAPWREDLLVRRV